MAPFSTHRVAARYLRKKALTEFGDLYENTREMADFLATQVDSLDDESVAYGMYAGLAVQGHSQGLMTRLLPKLVLSYRARLVGWFEHALLKRAKLGGGGTTIKKVELGLAAFVEAIPNIVASGTNVKLSDYLPENEYLDRSKLEPVAQRVLRVVWEEARKAGVLSTNRMAWDRTASLRVAKAMPFTLQWDAERKVWYIPNQQVTFEYRYEIGQKYRFNWNREERQWERQKLTPLIRDDFSLVERVEPPKPPRVPKVPGAPKVRDFAIPAVPQAPAGIRERIVDWFFLDWYPQNADRFTKVFTDYARNKESSYKIIFTAGAGGHPEVELDRAFTSVADAVEELSYRYLGRQGREPWIEVLDEFTKLVATTSPARLPGIIDRINNLQHSNGLFFEHFPKHVQLWYEKFLSAKYSSPTGEVLSKFIPDRELRMVMIEANNRVIRPVAWKYAPPDRKYQFYVKELEGAGEKINWRERGYPRFKGEAGKQRSRFDPLVQDGILTLRQLDTNRARLLSTEFKSPEDYTKWEGEVVEWKADYAAWLREWTKVSERVKAELAERDDLNALELWEKMNPPGSERLG